MAHCTYCKTKWKVKDVWSILVTFEKDCPYCFGRQYLSKKTINAMPELISLPLHFLFPFLVHLSDEGPLDWYRKNNITALFKSSFHYILYLYIP